MLLMCSPEMEVLSFLSNSASPGEGAWAQITLPINPSNVRNVKFILTDSLNRYWYFWSGIYRIPSLKRESQQNQSQFDYGSMDQSDHVHALFIQLITKQYSNPKFNKKSTASSIPAWSPHRSTDWTVSCLTSAIGRERVFSWTYGRSWKSRVK